MIRPHPSQIFSGEDRPSVKLRAAQWFKAVAFDLYRKTEQQTTEARGVSRGKQCGRAAIKSHVPWFKAEPAILNSLSSESRLCR